DDECAYNYVVRWEASFLYLNSHCFNVLYSTNRDGGFNVTFGSYKAPYFPEAEMRLFSEKARDTHSLFLCNDFRTTIPYVA
ncbi:DNA adenine methylase, partial [Klebsiella pneumoniae]|uniref:DNA adenine methylase n=1 Tax=Klebsiella pneumoniae TaxID=573 RepID=UPI002271C14B